MEVVLIDWLIQANSSPDAVHALGVVKDGVGGGPVIIEST